MTGVARAALLLFAGFELAIRADTSLLFDELGIDRAFKLRDESSFRAGGPLGHHARKRDSGVHFVGITSRDGTRVALES